MAYKSMTDGIIFVEGNLPNVKILGRVEYEKKGSIYNQQLKTLNDVKEQLVYKARSLGANAVVNFKYGQKSTSFLRSMLLRYDDDVNWYAEGTAAIIDRETFAKIAKQLLQNDDDE